MIVAGETSGELYGALLAEELKRKYPDIKILGIGGERMRAAGVELISGIASAFGIAEAVSALKKIRQTFKCAEEALLRERPAVIVLIDYPDFNLKLAARARELGIKVLYYVSPQVWAWRKGRVGKIARLVDRMAVILPFEVDIYKETGLECEFVGHPILDEIREMRRSRRDYKKELGLKEDLPLLSMLPGSRPHEMDRLFPVLLDVVRAFRKEFDGYQFCVPLAPNTNPEDYRQYIDAMRQEGAVISQGDSLKVLAASDLGVIASGTASLQAALLGVPIVVIYKLFPLTYLLGRMIVKVDRMSLVNILTGRDVVMELLQSEVTVGAIVGELKNLITDEGRRQRMLDDYSEVIKMFADKRSSSRVAEMVFELAGLKKG